MVDASAHQLIDAGDRRRVLDRAVLPSARATVGALLLALSGVVTFVAWQHASGPPDQSYVVAGQPLPPGERIGAADLRLMPLDLPDGVAAAAFSDPDAVVGRVALGPVGEGELVQSSLLSEGRSTEPTVEVAFALSRDRAVDGQLRSGDLVDVFVTYPDQTVAVGTGVRVIRLSGGDGFTESGQVTVTLALGADRGLAAALIHAVRVGEVTLVRSSEAGPAAPPGTAGSPPPGFAPPGVPAPPPPPLGPDGTGA